ncbi:4'-phosphopantetheinyl transferase [Oscillibacter sp.]|uniref:4'-phosphopantetheinyl transferase family protein n=1 Tax=Oscillibacter sp. TaxID=1945593 RepID=UPI0026178982|nr:4'-phosphopantetheinyl transferase [Oscillibacter sp.]MDD3346919.1 4'-phosphopantetheinyl transferase [Oscillibacter sp.]
MAVALWAGRLDRPLTEQETAVLMRLLPGERRERLARVRQAEKRAEPLCAYLLLRLALWEQYRWRKLPPILQTEMGKPWFPDYPSVQFNLSHTAGAVLVAVSGEPVGVDIEKIRPVHRRMGGDWTDEAGETAFFQSWVRREARSKLSGKGIGAMLRAEPPVEEGERFYALESFPGYAAGVATCAASPPGALRRYTLEELLKEDVLLTFMP